MKKYILVIIALLIYNYFQISSPLVANLDLEIKEVNRDIKITQISDFHNNAYLRMDGMIREIDKFNPDFIILTGDIIDRSTEDWTKSLDLIEGLGKVCQDIYFISGNHEEDNRGYLEFISDLSSRNVNIMDNRVADLDIDGNKIKLLGVKYYHSRDEYRQLISGIDNTSLNIILSHSPDRMVSNLTGVEDLILSGHTHGGQVRIPFIGGLIAPGQGFLPKYDKGFYEIEEIKLYIDSGLGNSILPLRTFNRVQISNISILS